MIQETFLPCIFFGKTKYLFPIVVYLTTMPVKKSGLGLLNPVTSANDKYLSFQKASTKFIQDVMRGGAFSGANHLLVFREERRNGEKKRDDVNDSKLKGLVRDLDTTNWRLILRAKIIGL